jgi:hypothetical protein
MANKKTDHAIKILQAQIDKGNEPNVQYSSWKLQSQSIIEKYFSKDSKEYTWFDRRVFADAYYGENPKAHFEQQTLNSIRNTQEHLRAAIETLRIKDIYEPPKPNFLYRLSDTWLTFILGLLLSGYLLAYQVGRWTVSTEKKSDITDTISPAYPVTENKAAQQIDTTKTP